MSKKTAAPGLDVTAGQPNDDWFQVAKRLGMIPQYCVPADMTPLSIEEVAALRNQGNGPLLEVVSRGNYDQLPQWDMDKAEAAKQKVAWYYANAQAQKIQPIYVEPPEYDPTQAKGADPIKLERYLRWENDFDTSQKYPIFNARINQPLPATNDMWQHNGNKNKNMFSRLANTAKQVKERLNMNTQNVYAQQQQATQGQQVQNQGGQPQQVPQFSPQAVLAQQQFAQACFDAAAVKNWDNPSWIEKGTMWVQTNPKKSIAIGATVGAGAGIGIYKLATGFLTGDSSYEGTGDEAETALNALLG